MSSAVHRSDEAVVLEAVKRGLTDPQAINTERNAALSGDGGLN